MRYMFRTRGTPAIWAWALLTAGLAACSSDDSVSPATQPEPAGSAATTASASADASISAPLITNRFGYVWANQPSSPSYTPSASYAHNALGGSIHITRSGAGTYAVIFDSPHGWTNGTLGFAITAYGASALRCLMRGHYTTGTQLVIDVHCFDITSLISTDSRFTLLVVGNGSLLPGFAFAFGNQPSAPSYTPNPLASYTSGPGPMVINHNATPGNYNVDLGTGHPAGSTFLVSAKDGFWNFCKVAQWHPTNVQVRCFDHTGTPHDGPYWALQVERGRPGRRIGYAWANQPTTSSYTPAPGYSFNSSGGAITAVRSAVGRYVVTFAGLQKLSGHTETVQVTGWGTGPTLCKVIDWSNVGTSLQARVECRRLVNGNLTDARFNILVIE